MSDVDCLLLAAGASSRMGRWKPMLPWGAGTVAEASAAAALAACSRVLLIVGHRGDELAAAFAGRERVEVVRNPGWTAGLFSSIRVGVAHVRTQRFFVALADMPLVRPEHYLRLLAAPAAAAVRPVYQGRGGHPVLLDSNLIAAILAEPETGTLRDVLSRVATLDLPVEDEGVVLDLDEPADYERLRNTVS